MPRRSYFWRLVQCESHQKVLFVDSVANNTQEVNGNLVLQGTDGTWSVDAVNDAAGGTNQFGLKNGIPVHLGNTAAIPVTLKVKSASG